MESTAAKRALMERSGKTALKNAFAKTELFVLLIRVDATAHQVHLALIKFYIYYVWLTNRVVVALVALNYIVK